MPYSSSTTLNVFISYASNDQAIVDALAATLRSAFSDAIEITIMSEFPAGLNWRHLIDDSIEKTDILIAVATGRLKPGHSFTGYEIGSFCFSLRDHRKMAKFPTIERRMIPFAVLDRVPDPMQEFQGIDLDPRDLHDIRFDASNLEDEISQLSEDNTDNATRVVSKFLADIENIILEAKAIDDKKINYDINKTKQRIELINKLSFDLCNTIFENISSRERDVRFPKSKISITLPSRPGSKEILKDALVFVHAPCHDTFGINSVNKSYNWDDFTKQAGGADIAYGWQATFQSLIENPDQDSFIENNVILSYDYKKLCRLFVSKNTVFYSGMREIQIYVVELLKLKDHGDPETTLLLKALQVSLTYRFMFLEDNSEYSSVIIKGTPLNKLRPVVLKMINSLTVILTIAEDAGLNDPGNVISILGKSYARKLDGLYRKWDTQKDRLYRACQAILSHGADKDLKDELVSTLVSFSKHTRDMNFNYTIAVMRKLEQKIAKSFPAPKPTSIKPRSIKHLKSDITKKRA